MPATTTGSRSRAQAAQETATDVIRTPDQRLRVFVSASMRELAAERRAAQSAVTHLRLVPVMFETGARPHPARELYRAYLAQSQVFVGVYWQSYGWVAPAQRVSGIEDEYLLAADMPRLIYVKSPAPKREPRLTQMLNRIIDDGSVAFKEFTDASELERLIENDLAILLSERFAMTLPGGEDDTPLAGALPAPATPLVDRQRDAAAVADLVLHRGARLVTLTGPGGVGKSRLAIEVAARLSPEFPGDVRFVDLSPVQSASLVPAAIAGGLGLSTSGDKLIADLVAYLHTRRLLLVIDNFEQVSGAAPLVSKLLAAAPGLTVLVTSRSVLRLSGEYEFAVSPLAVPPASTAGRDVARLRRYAAVQLFVQRASAAAPGFELTEDNAAAVAQICRRLDGLPLAIELAAARVRLLPPPALLARLSDGLQVLTSGARDLPERQRTLKNTLDWSYGLLSPDEQALFARLGVFAGTFGLPAAQAVGADGDLPGQPQAGVIDSLCSLVDNSLVEARTSGAEPRFRLLDIVREYALERLRETGDWDGAHDRHAAHFLALAEPAESELHGPGQLAWLERLEIRHDNLVAALSWLTSTGQLAKAVHMIWATWRFWWLHGHADELGQFTEKILSNSQDMAAHDRALALSGSGFVSLASGDVTRAELLFGQSLPLFQQSEDPLGGALAAAALGHLLAARQEYRRATELLDQTRHQLDTLRTSALTGAKRVQYLLVLALTENFLGQIQLSNGHHERAARHFASGLRAARAAPDRFTTLVSLYDLALSSQAQGNLNRAAALLEEGKSLAADTGDKPSTAYYLETLAEVASARRDPRRAGQLRATAETLLRAHGSGWLSAYVPRAPHDSSVRH